MSDFLCENVLGHIEHRSSSQNWQVRHFFRGYNFTEEVADRFFEYLDKARHRQTIVFLLDKKCFSACGLGARLVNSPACRRTGVTVARQARMLCRVDSHQTGRGGAAVGSTRCGTVEPATVGCGRSWESTRRL